MAGNRSHAMKDVIRDRMLRIRDQIPLEVRVRKDRLIREKFLSLREFIAARSVLLYASFRSEVGTGEIIRESLALRKKVFLPRVNAAAKRLDIFEIEREDELSPGFMGISEPRPADERRGRLDDMDVIVVPGTAFDRAGNRLGSGAGYYDISLSARTPRQTIIGLAYEELVVDALPVESHDIAVQIVVTDSRIIRSGMR